MPARPRSSEGSPQPRTVIPKLVTDPIWSLQPWPLDVVVGGDAYLIPAHPAAVWLTVLMSTTTDWLDVFPGLAESGSDDVLTQAVIEDRILGDEVTQVAKEILATVAARPWWVAVRLIRVSVESWDYLGGEVAMRGIDASRLSLSAWLDAVFHIMLRSMDNKEHTKFLLALEAPPEEEKGNVVEPEIGADEFMSMMR